MRSWAQRLRCFAQRPKSHFRSPDLQRPPALSVL
jgi:hypothetical protein